MNTSYECISHHHVFVDKADRQGSTAHAGSIWWWYTGTSSLSMSDDRHALGMPQEMKSLAVCDIRNTINLQMDARDT